jgi:hypothetical protein
LASFSFRIDMICSYKNRFHDFDYTHIAKYSKSLSEINLLLYK